MLGKGIGLLESEDGGRGCKIVVSFSNSLRRQVARDVRTHFSVGDGIRD